MAYYLTGDYYRGAAGDPGVFSFLGKVAKGVVGGVSGFLKSGPLGAIAGAVGGFTGRQAPVAPVQTLPGPVLTMGGTQLAPLAALPGGAPLVSQAPAAAGMSGYHLNKGRYYARSRGGVVEPGTVYVKNRSQNPTNVRALRRAIRREGAFIKIARRTGLVTVPRAKVIRKRAAKRR